MSSSSAPNVWIGEWKNDKGSVMKITAVTPVPGVGVEHFALQGTYTSRVGNAGANAFPLTGFVSEDQVAFTVSYRRVVDDEEKGSVCAWAGQRLPEPRADGSFSPEDEPKKLKLLWHLVPNFAKPGHEHDYGWLIAYSGEDIFTKV